MIHLSYDSIKKNYPKDTRLLSGINLHGVVSTDDKDGYLGEDGATLWLAFSQLPIRSKRHAIALRFHNSKDHYTLKKFRDEQELMQFLNLYETRDIRVSTNKKDCII